MKSTGEMPALYDDPSYQADLLWNYSDTTPLCVFSSFHLYLCFCNFKLVTL
jgi:hypothetical protein